MTLSLPASPLTEYSPAAKPTLYFIGVTTAKSAIMNIFPLWADKLGLGDVAIQGLDFKLHDQPASYRRAVEFIKHDRLSRGALVTTHKMDLFAACRDLFDSLDPYAASMRQVCSLCKRDGNLQGRAIDPITSGLALEAFLPAGHWERTGAEVLCLGAGGAATAISSYFLDAKRGKDKPRRLIVSDRTAARLEEIKRIHTQLLRESGQSMTIEYYESPQPKDNDALLCTLAPHSLIINATGLGKDAPGSPLSEAVVFPENGFAWDFNYRGALVFIDQARAQAQPRNLHVEDGWTYFLHGWTTVIGQVFEVEVPRSGAQFDELSRIAAAAR